MNKKFWAVVPAAGTGQRFGGDLPKQYQLLAGQAILERTLAKLLASSIFEGVVVALSDGDSHFDALASAKDYRVIKAVGGASRAASVCNALQALNGRAKSDDWIMVHDAARPLLSHASLLELNRVADKLSDHTGAILAVAVADTLKVERKVDMQKAERVESPRVEKTVSREGYWAAQTPQMFAYNNLLAALESLISQGREDQLTDEASAMELMGHAVFLVEGQPSNIKITRPDDMRLAEAYLLSEDGSKQISEKSSKENNTDSDKENSQ